MLDCLIIGAGPAGLTAAIYLRRFYRDVRIIDAGHSRAAQIPHSNNYPGFPDGIGGQELLQRLGSQLERFGGEVDQGTVARLQGNAEAGFSVEVGGQSLEARRVLLATGIVDVEPELNGFEEVKAQGRVRFCPICDGFEFTDQRIGVIGSGLHGIKEVEFIKNFSEKLSFIAFGQNAELDPALVRRLQSNHVQLVFGKGRRVSVTSSSQPVRLEMTDGAVHEFDTLYCALGSRARSQLALDLGADQDSQHCLVVDRYLQTTVPGLYAAGDVVSSLDQISVATGQAAIAATAIHNSLYSE